MFYIILSLSFFVVSVILHLFWCRVKRSAELQVLPFIVLAAGALSGYAVTERIFFKSYFYGPHSVWTLPLEITSVVFFVLLIPFYLVFYFSVNIDSPSRTILSILQKNKGLTHEQLKGQIRDEQFIVSRLTDLVDTRCVAFDGKNYRLLAHMTVIGRMLNLYQKLTGRPVGG